MNVQTTDQYLSEMNQVLQQSKWQPILQMQNFPVYAPSTSLSKFLCRYEIFKHLIEVPGSIIEGGVLLGAGLMTWVHLSLLFEPFYHQRKIIGFDTFQGSPSTSEEDGEYAQKHSFNLPSKGEIEKCLKVLKRAQTRVELVEGDACYTMPSYVKDHPNLIVAGLNLDFDLYAPTVTALEEFIPRMPKGGIIIWDELNCAEWPGESVATLPYLKQFKIQRLPFAETICWTRID